MVEKKLVLLTVADIIDQKNQLREVAQCQKYSKTADEVEKKVTTFAENIRPGQCQPYMKCTLVTYFEMLLFGAGHNIALKERPAGLWTNKQFFSFIGTHHQQRRVDKNLQNGYGPPSSSKPVQSHVLQNIICSFYDKLEIHF